MPSLCGVYYYPPSEYGYWTKHYLPQVTINAHTTIVGPTSRTDLTQTFVNPSANAIEELSYTFPLYDGVSVVAFTCTIGERVITGVVEERSKARHDYDEAVEQGRSAAIMEQSLDASDVFTTSIGNVPPKASLEVKITYLGELKHDAQVDGLRFTIPNTIAPRYGLDSRSASVGPSHVDDQSLSVTVDVELPEGSAIKAVQSPSHPIAVNIGTTSTATDKDPSLSRASATLTQGTTELGGDFVLHVVATKLQEPTALLETHPTKPNHHAIMATLVPKFDLPLEKPEIVFICDRSGSMGNSMPPLIDALQVFLKSLPVGVKFNICSFGSRYSFLWPKSKTYDEASLKEASTHVKAFRADYGGTQMLRPVEETFKQRFSDMNLEVFVLTDGEIWDQSSLFDLINEEVRQSKGAVRVFSLGIDSGYNGVSSALIEGIARAGGGFSQMVKADEKIDKKIVRMLKASLFPHIHDYSLEIKYGGEIDPKPPATTDDMDTEEDDFVLVEKIADALVISDEAPKDSKNATAKAPISLYNPEHKSDDTTKTPGETKFHNLPTVPTPRYLQTPSTIPGLFPYSRTTVYVLLSDSAPHRVPLSVVLKGTSAHGPLQLEIPITPAPQKATTLHQLAARQEVKDLEEGRGWLTHATDASGKRLMDKHPGKFDDMVEREAIRLGLEHTISGKWTSFVAIDRDGLRLSQPAPKPLAYDDMLVGSASSFRRCPAPKKFSAYSSNAPMAPARRGYAAPPPSGSLRAPPAPAAAESEVPIGSASFPRSRRSAPPQSSGVVTSQGLPPPSQMYQASSPLIDIDSIIERGNKLGNLQESSSRLASSAAAFRHNTEALAAESTSQNDMFGGFGRGRKPRSSGMATNEPPQAAAEGVFGEEVSAGDALVQLTALQAFDGSWEWTEALEKILHVSKAQASKMVSGVAGTSDTTVVATAVVIAFFRKRLASDFETWELMVDKALGWLDGKFSASADAFKATEELF